MPAFDYDGDIGIAEETKSQGQGEWFTRKGQKEIRPIPTDMRSPAADRIVNIISRSLYHLSFMITIKLS